MELEKQVCSLEYAKKLKELGIKQESIFYWGKPKTINGYGLCYIAMMFSCSEDHYDELYSAFTGTELGNIFLSFSNNGFRNIFYEKTCTNSWIISYKHQKNKYDFIVDDINEANARAKMLIYLLENGLIKNG